MEATEPSLDVSEKNTPKARKFWSDDDIKQHALDGRARSILTMALPDDIYHSVITCQSAKEIWDTLIVLFEGTPEVKKNKRSLLIQKYEMFKGKSGESITEIYERFNCLINDLRQHSTKFENEDVLIKFLRSLPAEWDNITIAIRQSKDLESMTLQALYGNLLTHELEVEQRQGNRKELKSKSVALLSVNPNRQVNQN